MHVVVSIGFSSLVCLFTRHIGWPLEIGEIQRAGWGMFQPLEQPCALRLVAVCVAILSVMSIVSASHTVAVELVALQCCCLMSYDLLLLLEKHNLVIMCLLGHNHHIDPLLVLMSLASE